jgi:hypothetical protein
LAAYGIKDLIEELKKIEGSNVWVHIGHKLYGDQNVKCAFQIVNDEKRLGFCVNNQMIYIDKDNICNSGIKGELYYFADEIMCIKIRKL